MNWITKILVKFAWPKVKKYLLQYVESNEYQELLINKVNEKIDIPNVSEKSEKKLLNQIYDAGQEVAIEFIETFNIEELMSKGG
jgi:hypothetical protein